MGEIYTGLGYSRFTYEKYKLININTRIDSVFCILTTVNLLLPTPVLPRKDKLLF